MCLLVDAGMLQMGDANDEAERQRRLRELGAKKV